MKHERQPDESTDQAIVRVATTPECLSASVLTICQNVEHAMHYLLNRVVVYLGHHIFLPADAVGDAGEELQLVFITHFGAEDSARSKYAEVIAKRSPLGPDQNR